MEALIALAGNLPFSLRTCRRYGPTQIEITRHTNVAYFALGNYF
jgi:hypothetical protein